MAVDFEQDLLLVTGASGRQATALIPHLVKQWKRLRLAVRSNASKEVLQRRYPNAEVTTCDLVDPRACRKLLRGVTACYLVTPPFRLHETECGHNIVNAALESTRTGGSFRHMLHSSVLHPNLRKLVNHDKKRYIEEYLIESGLPYTIIQPTHIMDTIPLHYVVKEEDPAHTLFWDPSTPFSFVSAHDIGEAAANILSQREKHFYATYELVGTPAPITYVQVVDIIGREIGKKVPIDQKSFEEALEMFSYILTKGKPEEMPWLQRQSVARMLMYYNDRGLIGNPNVLEMLLGRRPLDYESWVRMKVKEIKAAE